MADAGVVGGGGFSIGGIGRVGVVGGALVVQQIVTGTSVRWLSMDRVIHPWPGVFPAVKTAIAHPFWRRLLAGDKLPSEEEKSIWASLIGSPGLNSMPSICITAKTSACSPGLRVIDSPVGSSMIPVSFLRGPIRAPSSIILLGVPYRRAFHV